MDPDSSQPAKPKLHVRQIDINDLAAIFKLGEKLFTYRFMPNAYRIWDEHEVVDFFQTDPEMCFVCQREGQVVGFLLGSSIEKSSLTYGYLTWLGVDPAFKREGIGSRLVSRFISQCRQEGIRTLVVDTEADNAGAISFFTQVGFSNPEEHVYMTLNINGAGQAAKRRKTDPALNNGTGAAPESDTNAASTSKKRGARGKPA